MSTKWIWRRSAAPPSTTSCSSRACLLPLGWDSSRLRSVISKGWWRTAIFKGGGGFPLLEQAALATYCSVQLQLRMSSYYIFTSASEISALNISGRRYQSNIRTLWMIENVITYFVVWTVAEAASIYITQTENNPGNSSIASGCVGV